MKNQTSTDANSLAAKIILAVTVIALAVQLAISQVIAGSVTSALDSMRHVCEKLRDGDFRAGDHALERADEFGHLSTTMQQDTESAVSSMNEGCEAVVAGAQSVENLQKVFEQIQSLVENGAQKTILMDKAIKLVSSDAQNISASVADINAKGQVISQHMESVSAATEQQSASSEEIASASETLSNMAREQQQALRQFKF